jgi:6-phosphogluconolactonase (cycloisomerase 2 family)
MPIRFFATARRIAGSAALCLIISCSSDSSGPAGVPTLSSISPTSGVQGTTITVTVTGTNFIAGGTNALAPSGTGVTVSDVNVTSTTSATARVTIAADAPLGTRTFTLTTAAGASGTLTFTILPASPTLTSLSPATVVEGTTVTETLTGTNFVAGATTVAVSGAGVTVSAVNVVSATSLTASFAINRAADIGARQVTVTTVGGTSAAQTLTINPPAPVLTSIDPASGLTGTTVRVTVTGSGLVPGATTVNVSGTGVTVNNVSVSALALVASSAIPGTGTSLTADFVIAQGATLGVHNVTITTAGGTSGAVPFTVNSPAPTVGTYTANPTAIQLGQTSKLTWSGITNATTCTISDGVGNISCADGSVTVQPTSNTTYMLTVTGPGGTAKRFVAVDIASPSIASFAASPAVILVGNSTTLSWSGIPNATACSIDQGIGLVSCSAFSVSVSPVTTTTYTLTATGPSGTVSAVATVTVNPQPPHIGAFTANPTSILLGNSSPLSWSGITNATTCAIDNAVGSVSCADGTTNVSPGASTTYTLTATGPGGSVTATASVTVNVVVPTLTAVTPNSGVQGTTASVTLTGTDFVVGGTTVSVSGTGVSVNNVSVSSSTSLTADFVIAGGATLGAHNVTVTTASGTSGAQTFTINPPPPTLATVNPNQGAQGGTRTVTLTGTNFVPGATSVSVSGSNVTVSNVNVSSATQLTADFAVALSAALGARNVTVTTAGGTSGAQTFTVIAGPVINSFAALATHLTVRQPTTVAWSTSNAATCSITPTFFSQPCNGSGIVTPGTNTTYTLTASSAGASVNASSSVFVNEPGRWVFSSANLDNQLRMFSLNPTTGDLAPIGGGTIATGNRPVDVTVDPSGKYAYTTNSNSDNISMYTINATTGALTANGTILAGPDPRAIAVDPTGRYAYVVNQNVNINGDPGSVSVYTINSSGQLVANGAAVVVGGQPTKVAVDPLGKYVYVVNFNEQNIAMFGINADGTLASLGTQTNGLGAFGIAADPSGRFVYSTTHANGRVRAYGIGSNGTLIFGGDVAGTGTMGAIAVDPTGRWVYALDSNNNFIHTYSINQTTGNLTAVGGGVATGGGPSEVSVDPQGKFVYTANQAGTISIFSIDQSTGAVTLVNTVAAGTTPRGIVVSR